MPIRRTNEEDVLSGHRSIPCHNYLSGDQHALAYVEGDKYSKSHYKCVGTR
ncbi:hypothetical protein Lalb_Chr09g0328621 [Lupinus albus]|uniref:Uncharacterized protein n=1 Tax=Lupinus albus TaxID=3870 RepID=A0A6A4Q1D5_LUPAL|nr:hypothetical protein Lalb_Chr09g0328621 [Lupinus albus]